MYAVVRIEERPNTGISFFVPDYTDELKVVLNTTGAAVTYELSNGDLQCVYTFTWPTEEDFNICVNTQVVIDLILNARDEYNALNGISSIVEYMGNQ